MKRIQVIENEPKFDSKFVVPKEVIVSPETYQLSKIFNWYNENNKESNAEKWLFNYAKEKFPEDVEHIITSNFRLPICWLARQAKISVLTKSLQKRLDDTIKNNIQKVKESLTVESKSTKTVRSIQDKIASKISYFKSVIDDAIEDFIQAKYKSDFDLSKVLSVNNVSHSHIPALLSHVQNLKSDCDAALSGDQDCVEAYLEVHGKKNLNKIMTFADTLIEVLNKYRGEAKQIAKKTRKPRTVKKNPHKSVLKLRYKKSDDDYKLRSIEPVKVVGAEQLWIFNTKTRRLGVYRCSNVHGLFVKGSTIKNFDEKISIEKTIRKPEKILESTLTAGKVALRKLLEDVKAVEKKLSGRVNSDCILVRAI